MQTPFVTTIAVLSLALGIGANAAIYSIFDEMLRRPLPVPHPSELVSLAAPGPKPGSQSCGTAGGCDVVFSYPMYRDLEKGAPGPVFIGLAAHCGFDANVAVRGETIAAEGMYVSGSYFPVLQVVPALGRLLSPDDDRTIGGHPVVVLSYDYWQHALGADSTLLDRPITVNGITMTVVGVAPRGFDGTTLGVRPKLFVPMTMRGALTPSFTGYENRRSYWVYVFGRLRSGATMTQGKNALNAIYQPILNDVEAAQQKKMSAETMAKFRVKTVLVTDGRRGQSDIEKEAGTPLFILFCVTGVVLLIACANITNLLLARGASRSMEMAVRLSLGATRGRLLVQLLTESLLLAAIGGLASLAVAWGTLRVITAILPGEIAESMHFALSGAAIAFAAAVSVATGLLVGLVPALHSTRPDLITTLRADANNLSVGRRAAFFRSALVTTQIGLSMALLILAGLFVKSLHKVSGLDLGLDVDHVATFTLSPYRNGYDAAHARVLFTQLQEQIAGLPGVTGVSASLVPLISGDSWVQAVSVQGFTKGPDTDNSSRVNEVGPGYFALLGIPLLAGREFTTADAGPKPLVAIVNETFARKFGLGRDAVGKLMSSGNDSLGITIIGLAKDAKYSDVKDTIPPVFFLAAAQDSALTSASFLVRSVGDPAPVLRSISAVVKRVDATLPVEELKTMPQQVRENVFLDRMISILSASFAALATLLAAIGLYGVLAYTVSRRTREIGVRMALGADSRRVAMMVVAQVGVMTLIGGVAGTAAAIALGRAARSILFEITNYDPVVLVGSVVLLALVAFVAAFVPARRASRVDPIRALRYE